MMHCLKASTVINRMTRNATNAGVSSGTLEPTDSANATTNRIIAETANLEAHEVRVNSIASDAA
jgi:hypothetical protein